MFLKLSQPSLSLAAMSLCRGAVGLRGKEAGRAKESKAQEKEMDMLGEALLRQDNTDTLVGTPHLYSYFLSGVSLFWS